MSPPQLAALAGLLLAAAALVGACIAWWLHRRTTLSAWNVYLVWVVATVVVALPRTRGG